MIMKNRYKGKSNEDSKSKLLDIKGNTNTYITYTHEEKAKVIWHKKIDNRSAKTGNSNGGGEEID